MSKVVQRMDLQAVSELSQLPHATAQLTRLLLQLEMAPGGMQTGRRVVDGHVASLCRHASAHSSSSRSARQASSGWQSWWLCCAALRATVLLGWQAGSEASLRVVRVGPDSAMSRGWRAKITSGDSVWWATVRLLQAGRRAVGQVVRRIDQGKGRRGRVYE